MAQRPKRMPTRKAPGSRYARYDQRRGNSGERGYDARWQRARAAFLVVHPFCRACEAAGRTTSATCVDHIIPHRGDRGLFWDRANWQPLCDACHAAKTRKGL